MGCFNSEDVRQLLHNKMVVVLGDSIQRAVYKDLVKLLQNDHFLSEKQLKNKGEMTFENDTLVEGGTLNEMHNGTTYREVRQYRTGHHLVRFYFLTRAYSTYLESVLSDFKSGPQPDVVIVNSCIWDIKSYRDIHLEDYKNNLDSLFHRLAEVLRPECLVIWNMTMPVGFKECEIPEFTKHNIRWDIVQGNFYSSTLADLHKMDVLDMHYHFRFDLRFRCRDAVHWNQLAHRKYTQILLTHIAQAWGVEAPESSKKERAPVAAYMPGYATFSAGNIGAGTFLPGYFNFDDCFQPNGVLLPGYLSFDNHNNHQYVASSFVDDSPVLVGNVTPGCFNVHMNWAPPAGNVPMFNNNNHHHPFPRARMFPQAHSEPPVQVPFQPSAWSRPHTWKMKRAARQGRVLPYYPPPGHAGRFH